MSPHQPGLPHWARVRQSFPGEPVRDITAAVTTALQSMELAGRVRRGQRVAITAGSRGIANVVATTAALVAECRRLGAEPFVFPCMGSHGNATPSGQLEVLTSYGVTPEAVGAPVISQGELVELGSTAGGIPLWCDRLAAEADHIVVVNRVKPHTDFTGRIESGPTKMLAIGLGKHRGASECHQRFVERGYEAVIREVGDALWERLPVVGALGLVENGHDQTIAIGGVRREQHEEDEAALLEQAKASFGYLPFDRLHILMVDAIGKNISGAGMDPNVTGTDSAKTHRPPDRPSILRILVRGLTPESHGNAAGIGQADFALERCLAAVDWEATATNVVIAASPESGRRPLSYPTDAAMLEAALLTTGPNRPESLRLVRIENTLRVDDLLVSEPLLGECRDHPRCEIVSEPEPVRFDSAGMLLDQGIQDLRH